MTKGTHSERPALNLNELPINDLTAWLARRATVRKFDPDAEIDNEAIREIIDAGRKAPTSGTTQMYSFLWIQDPDLREHIHELCDRGTQQIEEASHFLLVCIDLRRIRLLLEHRDRDFAIVPTMGILEGAIDASLATMSVMIAAESREYGVCPIGNILNNLDKISAAVGVPDGILPIYGLCIGVPITEKAAENAPRIPLNAILHEAEYEDPSLELLDDCFDAMNKMYGDSVYGDSKQEWQETLERYWGPNGFMSRRENTLLIAMQQQGFFADYSADEIV